MPPKKRSAEDKEKAFNDWQEGKEFQQINILDEARAKNAEASIIEMSTIDINTDWTEVLTELHKLSEVMKVPALKTKSKL